MRSFTSKLCASRLAAVDLVAIYKEIKLSEICIRRRAKGMLVGWPNVEFVDLTVAGVITEFSFMSYFAKRYVCVIEKVKIVDF